MNFNSSLFIFTTCFTLYIMYVAYMYMGIVPEINLFVFVNIKYMFLYSAVSSLLDHSKRFTLYRPVHSGNNSTSLGSILAMQQLRVNTIHSHFHHCL